MILAILFYPIFVLLLGQQRRGRGSRVSRIQERYRLFRVIERMFSRLLTPLGRTRNVLGKPVRFNTTQPSGSQESRAARKARAATNTTVSSGSGSGTSTNKYFMGGLIGISAVLGLSGYAINEIKSNPNGQLGKAYSGSNFEKAVNFIQDTFLGKVNDLFDPVSDKLIPDWPTAPCYANVPPGTPCPPLLIVDLERTLVGSTHDIQYGWRHVKRPGLEKFIKSLAGYYEVVLFSENDIGIAQEIMDAVDPEGMTHKLGSAAGEMRGTKVLKRLEYMNRDPRRILVIDDNPESVELCMDNVLLVPPFLDVNNKHDKTLENLIPLLQAFVHDGVEDFQKTLKDLGTHEAEEAVAEYRMRLAEVREKENRRRNRGLGGLIRGKSSASSEDDGFAPRSAVLSPADIVGSSAQEVAYHNTLEKLHGGRELNKNYFNKDKPKPSEIKKKGGLMAMLEQAEEKKAEEQMLKQMKMNEIYQQRMAAKAKAQELAQEEE